MTDVFNSSQYAYIIRNENKGIHILNGVKCETIYIYVIYLLLKLILRDLVY